MRLTSFCIIGLGNFGRTLAETLASRGNQVLVIDIDDKQISEIADKVTNAVVGDATDEAVLKAAGVKSYDCAIVCLGQHMQDSILVTLMLKEMGLRKIVARALSDRHSKVLSRVGADQIVFPEKDMALKTAYALSKTDVLGFIEYSKDFSIVELKTPRKWVGRSIKELNVRQRFGVNIIATLDVTGDFKLFADPERKFGAEETLIIIGQNDSIEKLTK
ncbi:MAG TPA: TrkA family potassium uptake protein [Bacillota bacterium]|nr:TrkA family potassium uptake protein [Bacillota bacterium]